MVVWLLTSILACGAVLTWFMAARVSASKRVTHSKAPLAPVVVEMLEELREAIENQEFETGQLRELVLDLRIQCSDLRGELDREVGDGRRAFKVVFNRLERLNDLTGLVAMLDAEVEKLEKQQGLATSNLRLVEGDARDALAT
jgi:hypothetical protein